MVQLAGQFAGAVLVMVPEEQVAPLTAALRGLGAAGLRVAASPAALPAPRDGGRMLKLGIVGQDRPGILRDVTAVLAGGGHDRRALDRGGERLVFGRDAVSRLLPRAGAGRAVGRGVAGRA